MERVTKVYFNPLLSNRESITSLLESLPVGSAHAFNGELLLHAAQDVVESIDISMHNEDYFTNAISLEDLGEKVLNRMKLFKQISTFNEEYTIQQAPASTFTIPIVEGKIHIFAVSARTPSYYDLCLADTNQKTSCYGATRTFSGITHSGDVNQGNNLLQYFQISSGLDEVARTIFVSGFQYNKLRNYKAYNPVVLVVNHKTKTLYTIPVPLDAATIGDATICCPLVIKKDNESLLCSILATPATEADKMCTGNNLNTDAFATAIERAVFVLKSPAPVTTSESATRPVIDSAPSISGAEATFGGNVVLGTRGVQIPDLFAQEPTQVIRFGKGLEWVAGPETDQPKSISVLPCILGGILEGPLILATGQAPLNMPFDKMANLHKYYQEAKSVTVIVDEQMTDNARNLATNYRLNALFIVQKSDQDPENSAQTSKLLDNANINAITALAGPQSLVLVQLGSRYYFYRGMADPEHMDTSEFEFGHDVTEVLARKNIINRLQHTNWPRLVDILQDNFVYLPKTKQTMKFGELKETFHTSSLAQIRELKGDIVTLIPQLQALLSQDKLQELCSELIGLVEKRLSRQTGPARKDYAQFVTREFDIADPESRKKKNKMLSDLRKLSNEGKNDVQWLTQLLGNVVSSQTSSTRTHDLKRLVRQSAIKGNVEAAKSMNFEKLTDMLEEHAAQMGVLLINVKTDPYQKYIRDASYLTESPGNLEICALDSRTIYLEGLDAGLVLEQSQEEHSGPLASQLGKLQPVMALATLDQHIERGSMLAWVCWDEFVNLEDPYSVRWMEKCNEPHIAALRIIMRSTLSDAISSRELDLNASNPSTGQLMASLLMSAMTKLAATRNTPSGTVKKAEDTTTLLMRGLFGNLLTIAGSGLKPISFVWQLFGTIPQFEIPSNSVDWNWYEATTRLMPYSGWKLKRYQKNLTGLLDKIIFRMMTKNEKTGTAALRLTSLADYCVARNVQLLHSRTIVTALKKMLTEQEDCKDAAARLLDIVPSVLENETESYRRLHRYIEHLAAGGKQRVDDNLLAANVFTKRSAVFSKAKKLLATAADNKNKDKVIQVCQEILKERARIEEVWGLSKDTVHVQGLANINKIMEAAHGEDEINAKLVASAKGDFEQKRQAWHIGKDQIEGLDVAVLNHILYGNGDDEVHSISNAPVQSTTVAKNQNEFEVFADSMEVSFLNHVRVVDSAQGVSRILGVPQTALEAFAAMLAPEFNMERLPETFKSLVLLLLRIRNRDAETMKPTAKLFEMSV